MTDFLTKIDLYCERTSLELLAEPLNLVSNAAFLIAALQLARHFRAHPAPRDAWLLTGLIFLIGTGSALFHSFANRLTGLMDVLPIAAFILCYLAVYLKRVLGWHAPAIVAATVTFLAAAFAARALPIHTGVMLYLPSLALLWLFAGDLFRRRHALAPAMLRAALIFSASLTFRTLDGELCAQLPIGTHFLWHVLNAWLLYTLVRLLPFAPRA